MSDDSSPAKRKSLAKFRKSLDVAERDARACRRYYAERMTYREIAAELGYTNETGAKRSSDRGLKAIQTRGNETLIAEVRTRIGKTANSSKGSGTTRHRRSHRRARPCSVVMVSRCTTAR